MQQKIVEVNGKIVSVKFYTQTHRGDISDELSKACSGAFIAEKDIYVVNEETFGEDSFNKAFLGRNKVEGGLKENLPYDPDDIRVFNNTI